MNWDFFPFVIFLLRGLLYKNDTVYSVCYESDLLQTSFNRHAFKYMSTYLK